MITENVTRKEIQIVNKQMKACLSLPIIKICNFIEVFPNIQLVKIKEINYKKS